MKVVDTLQKFILPADLFCPIGIVSVFHIGLRGKKKAEISVLD